MQIFIPLASCRFACMNVPRILEGFFNRRTRIPMSKVLSLVFLNYRRSLTWIRFDVIKSTRCQCNWTCIQTPAFGHDQGEKMLYPVRERKKPYDKSCSWFQVPKVFVATCISSRMHCLGSAVANHSPIKDIGRHRRQAKQRTIKPSLNHLRENFNVCVRSKSGAEVA